MRLAAPRALRIGNYRGFSISQHHRNSNNELLDLLGQNQHPQSTLKAKRILILKPDQTKDKVISKFISNQKDKKNKSSSHLRRNQSESYELPDQSQVALTNNSGLVESVEQFKPKHHELLNSSVAKDLTDHLAKSFTKTQMLEYLDLKDSKKAPKSYTKAKLAKHILELVWELKVDDSMYSAMLRQELLSLSEEELSYLNSQSGQLTLILKAAVASLKINSSKRELTLSGTDYQISNAKVNLYSQFASAQKEEIDLRNIHDLYIKKFGEADFEKIGKANDVYFKHIVDHKYELCSLRRQNIERVKRLILWNLDFNLHTKTFLHLPPNNELDHCALLQRADPLSTDWITRTKAIFQLVSDRQSSGSSRLTNDLKNFSSIDFGNLDFKEDPLNVVRNPEPIEDETFDILETLGFLKDEPELAASSHTDERILLFQSEVVNNHEVPTFKIGQSTKKLLYSELSDFSYREGLRGVCKEQLDNHLFTISLGRTTFSKRKVDNALCTPPPDKSTLLNNYSFDTNIPLVYDHALCQSIAPDGLNFLEDPHQYSMQFKFMPTPVDNAEGKELNEQMKYPPIEMWVGLNGRSILDLETIQLVSVEGENNAFVCLPNQKSDLKVSCQITGQLLDPNILDRPDEESILGSTADKFAHLSSQPGVREFLSMLSLDFSGKTKPIFSPRMKVVFEGKMVDYTFINVRHRRELSLNAHDNIIVQLSTIDGGFLGGRKSEVRLIGNLNSGLSRESFDSLLDFSVDFVNTL